MKIMRLMQLDFAHFQGTDKFRCDTRGNDVSVYGRNGAGKSTLANFIFWVLFDKNSLGAKDFEIKKLDANNEAVHNLCHGGTLVFDLDGDQVSFSKTYKETWEKKRGSARADFTGHTSEYKINLVGQQKKEFEAYLDAICPNERLRLLTDPHYGPRMGWQKLRSLLLEVCGDVTDADVIASNPKLSALPGIIGRHSIDDFKKMAIASRRETNKELESIPVRIDELRKDQPELAKPDGDPESIIAQIAELTDKKATIMAGGGVSELRAEIARLDAQILEHQNKARAKAMTGADAIRVRLATLDTAIANSKSEISGLNIQLEDGATRLQAMDQVLADLRAAYAKENAKAFTWSEEAGVCGACGQALPEHKVAEIRAEAEAEFNQAKARALEANKIQGQTKVKQRDEFESKLTLTKQTLATAEGLLAAREEERACILEELEAVSIEAPEADEIPGLTAKKREIQAQIADLATGASDAVSEIELAIRDCRGQLQDHERYRARQEEIANRTKRVEELEEKENRLSAEIERIDRELGLCEEFTRAKVRALTDRINAKFRITSFKLFEEQINGGLQECCEPMLEGRPYSTAMSNSERINVGLDIIRTLEEHWGFAPPVVIDNCESVSDPLPTHGQQIRLIVSKADETLRVELSPMTAQDGQEALAI